MQKTRLYLYGRTCVCLFFILVFFGCTSSHSLNSNAMDTEKQKVNSTDIVATDSGKLLEIEKGMEFQVSLEANATAGFQWMAKSPDETMLEVVDKRFVLHDNAEGKVGTAGTAIMRYKVLKSGQTMLQLQLCRPWDCESTVVETFELEIVVTDPKQEKK